MPESLSLADRPWKESDLVRLYQGRLNNIPYAVLAEQLDRPVGSLIKKYETNKEWATKLKLGSPRAETSFQDNKAEYLENLSSRVDARLYQNRIRADLLGDIFREVVPRFPVAPTMEIYKPSKGGDKKIQSPEDMLLMLSDLHLGLKVSLEETGGLASYSLLEYHERLKYLQAGVKDIYELHSKLYDIPYLNIAMLGDITHGMTEVGKWGSAYTEADIVEQFTVGITSLSEMIYYFLGMFKEIRIFTVSGNHGRAANKGVEKEHVNWDYLAYLFIQQKFADNPRVKMYTQKSWWTCPMIRNHNILMLHGEDVKGGNVPIRSLSLATQKLSGLLNCKPDAVLAGHFHTASEMTTNHGEVILNGSFVGPDIHSLKSIHTGGKPVQKIIGLHDKRGVTWRYNIDLTGKK